MTKAPEVSEECFSCEGPSTGPRGATRVAYTRGRVSGRTRVGVLALLAAKADELSSPSLPDKVFETFETCLVENTGGAWRFWETRDLGPSVALGEEDSCYGAPRNL